LNFLEIVEIVETFFVCFWELTELLQQEREKKVYIQNKIVSSDCSLRFNLKCTSGSFETEKNVTLF
jgi:hypothetical protein